MYFRRLNSLFMMKWKKGFIEVSNLESSESESLHVDRSANCAIQQLKNMIYLSYYILKRRNSMTLGEYFLRRSSILRFILVIHLSTNYFLSLHKFSPDSMSLSHYDYSDYRLNTFTDSK